MAGGRLASVKVLVVAHPDDEVIWFTPNNYGRIIIVHLARIDDPGMSERRKHALQLHPLKDRITCLGLTESNYWRDASRREQHEQNYRALCEFLKTLRDVASDVTTHNVNGEYGHADHILVHNACMDTMHCPVNGKDPAMYRAIKKVYIDNGCWTWN